MRVVYHAENLIDAHLVKDVLDHAGIPCFINGEFLTGGVGQLPARDFLTVSVPDICVEDAGPVVHDITEMLRAPVDDDASDSIAAPAADKHPASPPRDKRSAVPLGLRPQSA